MSRSSEEFLVSEAGGVLTFRFNRPDKLNAINANMRDGLAAAVKRFGETPELRVLVIRSTGRYFSAGMDITAMGDMPVTGVELRHQYRQLHNIFDEMEKIEKPVVSAIHAPCFGGSLEMSLSCDFRLAAERAVFALPEIEIGVIPGSGGTSRLTQLVGRGWARWLLMGNQRVTAQRALIMGLVQEVYPDDEFDAGVDAFVQTLVSLPNDVMGLQKVAIDLAASTSRESARFVERVANTILINGDEHKNAVELFRRGRPKAGS